MPRNVIIGSTIKGAVNPWDLDSTRGWTTSGDADTSSLARLYRAVPWFRRGVKDRALNVSTLPWVILRGDVEVATSAEWGSSKPRDLEWLANPQKLFAQIEQSLAVTGRAYLFLEVNPYGYIKRAVYCAPATITEVTDPATGAVVEYIRAVGAKQVRCTPAGVDQREGWGVILPIYDADYMTEDGQPPSSSDGLSALAAAGVLYSIDRFVEQFFSRGAIKASVLTVEGGNQSEIDRLQMWWDDVITGVKNAWTALVMRGKLNAPVVIGEGIESLENQALTEAKRQEIATALGVPESRMWSAAANYATRNEDEKAYFRGTILPEFGTIAGSLNETLFTKRYRMEGYRIEAQPETLDVFQTEEADRSGSLAQMVGAGVPLLLAMQLLGYDLTEEQAAMLTVSRAVEIEPAVVEVPEPEEPEEREERTIAQVKELEIWQRKSIKAFKLSGRANCEFTTEHLTASDARNIRAALEDVTSIDDIKSVFSGKPPARDDIGRLADVLKAAVAYLETPEPQAQTQPVQLVMPDGAIVINNAGPVVNVPEQPAPVVNVEPKINVAPSPAPSVKVEPKITVSPSPAPNVTIQEQQRKTITVTRDYTGKITGAELE